MVLSFSVFLFGLYLTLILILTLIQSRLDSFASHRFAFIKKLKMWSFLVFWTATTDLIENHITLVVHGQGPEAIPGQGRGHTTGEDQGHITESKFLFLADRNWKEAIWAMSISHYQQNGYVKLTSFIVCLFASICVFLLCDPACRRIKVHLKFTVTRITYCRGLKMHLSLSRIFMFYSVAEI